MYIVCMTPHSKREEGTKTAKAGHHTASAHLFTGNGHGTAAQKPKDTLESSSSSNVNLRCYRKRLAKPCRGTRLVCTK